MPGEQLVESSDLVVGDAAQNVGEPGLRIDAIQLGAFDQGIGDGGRFAAALGADEEVVFPSEGQFPFILPMSGRFAVSIIAGMPISGWMLRSFALCGGMMGRM
jgi:hypothetical protein